MQTLDNPDQNNLIQKQESALNEGETQIATSVTEKTLRDKIDHIISNTEGGWAGGKLHWAYKDSYNTVFFKSNRFNSADIDAIKRDLETMLTIIAFESEQCAEKFQSFCDFINAFASADFEGEGVWPANPQDFDDWDSHATSIDQDIYVITGRTVEFLAKFEKIPNHLPDRYKELMSRACDTVKQDMQRHISNILASLRVVLSNPRKDFSQSAKQTYFISTRRGLHTERYPKLPSTDQYPSQARTTTHTRLLEYYAVFMEQAELFGLDTAKYKENYKRFMLELVKRMHDTLTNGPDAEIPFNYPMDSLFPQSPQLYEGWRWSCGLFHWHLVHTLEEMGVSVDEYIPVYQRFFLETARSEIAQLKQQIQVGGNIYKVPFRKLVQHWDELNSLEVQEILPMHTLLREPLNYLDSLRYAEEAHGDVTELKREFSALQEEAFQQLLALYKEHPEVLQQDIGDYDKREHILRFFSYLKTYLERHEEQREELRPMLDAARGLKYVENLKDYIEYCIAESKEKMKPLSVEVQQKMAMFDVLGIDYVH